MGCAYVKEAEAHAPGGPGPADAADPTGDVLVPDLRSLLKANTRLPFRSLRRREIEGGGQAVNTSKASPCCPAALAAAQSVTGADGRRWTRPQRLEEGVSAYVCYEDDTAKAIELSSFPWVP